MLKKSASGVLASFRGSTLGRSFWEVGNVGGFSVRQDPLQGRTARTKCGMYLLASSLAAALLGTRRVSARQGWAGEKSGLLERPAWCTPVIPDVQTSEISAWQHSFSAASRTEPTRAERLEQRNVDRLDIHLTAQDQHHCFLPMGSGLLLRWTEDTVTEPMMTLRPRNLSE